MFRNKLIAGGMALIFLASMFKLMTFTPTKVAVSGVMLDFDFPKGAKGVPAKLSDLRGKVVLIDFWATWCGPCQMSMPELQALYTKYHSQGLEVIGISEDDASTVGKIPETLKSLGVTYPTIMEQDLPNIRSKFIFDGLPALFFIDKMGILRKTQQGYDPQGNLDADVAPLLKE